MSRQGRLIPLTGDPDFDRRAQEVSLRAVGAADPTRPREIDPELLPVATLLLCGAWWAADLGGSLGSMRTCFGSSVPADEIVTLMLSRPEYAGYVFEVI